MKPHIEVSRDSQTCGSCSGTGCWSCGSTGEEAAPVRVEHIQCMCGAEITGSDWHRIWEVTGKCPECGEILHDLVQEALAEPDGEPWDGWWVDDEPVGLDTWGCP